MKVNTKPTVTEWQDGLEDLFSVGGIIGITAVELKEYERNHALFITERYRGHDLLMNAFFDFYTETLTDLENDLSTRGWPQDKRWYSVLVTKHFSLLTSFRAADRLLYYGYPNDAFGLLRDIRDRALYLGAVINKYTTLQEIEGVCESEEKPKNFKKLIDKAKEFRGDALVKMCGKKSGLSPENQPHLQKWIDMFHQQVHGARYSDFRMFSNLRAGVLSALPTPDEKHNILYMNRATELAWMIIRLLCALQLEVGQFGKVWVEKWHYLDFSFRYFENSLADLGKPFANALIELLDTKFSFYPEKVTYAE